MQFGQTQPISESNLPISGQDSAGAPALAPWSPSNGDSNGALTSPIARELERTGVAVVPDLLTKDQLTGMQRAFARKLKRMRWNDCDGYEKTEIYRHMVQDVPTLDQGVKDIALHPRDKEALR